MGWESYDMIRFDLMPHLRGNMTVRKLKLTMHHLLLPLARVLECQMLRFSCTCIYRYAFPNVLDLILSYGAGYITGGRRKH